MFITPVYLHVASYGGMSQQVISCVIMSIIAVYLHVDKVSSAHVELLCVLVWHRVHIPPVTFAVAFGLLCVWISVATGSSCGLNCIYTYRYVWRLIKIHVYRFRV